MNRFDDPAGRFRVCYLGTTIDVCFAETFLKNPPGLILALEDLANRSIAVIETTRDLRLVTVSQAWSRTLWDHPDAADGIVYRSRHDNSAKGIAIHHRAKAALTVLEERRLTDDPKLLARLLRKYDVGLTR